LDVIHARLIIEKIYFKKVEGSGRCVSSCLATEIGTKFLEKTNLLGIFVAVRLLLFHPFYVLLLHKFAFLLALIVLWRFAPNAVVEKSAFL
jgi:hypothetical protein